MRPLNTLTLVVLALVFAMAASTSTAEDIRRIILDTDMRGDCDDAGALAALHALADNGECEILGVMASTTGPHVASVIGAINNFYGRPDFPVGLYAGTGIRGDDYYAPVVGDPFWFPSRVSNATATESTTLYRRLLHEAPDSSVSIVVIGGQPCIHGLLVSEADYEPPTQPCGEKL
jgi:inosine-uridine nucleoside N-ribohydrolase